MLKRANRLAKKKDFDNVFKRGRSSYDKIMGIKIADNGLNNLRFGIIISNKVSKSAVKRNKIRRWIRDVIEREENGIRKDKDCVIICFPLILEKDYHEVSASIRRQFGKLGLYA